MKRFLIKIIFLLTFFYTDIQFANEILIYADSISYDSEKNLIAKGNVKIINANEIITSDLIIYNNAQQKYILPKKFTFKDEKNNYYYGESGYFSKNLKELFFGAFLSSVLLWNIKYALENGFFCIELNPKYKLRKVAKKAHLNFVENF